MHIRGVALATWCVVSRVGRPFFLAAPPRGRVRQRRRLTKRPEPQLLARLADDPLDDDEAQPPAEDEDDDGDDRSDDDDSLELDDLDKELGLVAAEDEDLEDADEDEEDDDDDEDEDEEASLEELLQMGTEGTDAEAEWARREEMLSDSLAKEEKLEQKRKKKREEVEAFERSRGIGFLEDEPVCRAVVAVVTRGSADDNATVAKLETAIRDRCGDRVIVSHNPDDDPEEDMPLFEVWIEGYRAFLLHSRNFFREGDLTDDKIAKIANIAYAETTDDAKQILGSYGFYDDVDD